MALFGSSPYLESHPLRHQRRSRSECLGCSHGLEAGTLIKTPRWTVTTRDTQVQNGGIPFPNPRDNRSQEHPACTQTAVGGRDPHLIEKGDVEIGRIDAAPRQPDRLALCLREDRQIRFGFNARGKPASPLGIEAVGLFRKGAAKSIGRISKCTQPQVSVDAPLLSRESPYERRFSHDATCRRTLTLTGRAASACERAVRSNVLLDGSLIRRHRVSWPAGI